MIIKTAILTEGKECFYPQRYEPNIEMFKKYAHLYQKDPQELFEEVKTTVDEVSDYEDMSSEEKEDTEIRKTDRIVCALIEEENDPRLEVYLYDKETEAFYVHHDVFIHDSPTSLAALDRAEDPFVFVSNENGEIIGYNLFVSNHFFPDLVIDAHDSSIREIESEGELLVSTDGNSLKGWSSTTQKSLFVEGSVKAEALSINKSVFFSSAKSLFRYDQREGAAHAIFKADSDITGISTSESVVAVGTAGGDILYSIDGQQPQRENTHKEKINSLVVTENRYIASASKDGSITLYDTKNRELLFRKETSIDTITINMPKDDRSLYVFPSDSGDQALEMDSFEDVFSKTE